MSLGGGLVMWGRIGPVGEGTAPVPGGPAQGAEARLLRRGVGGDRGLVDAAAPAVHGVECSAYVVFGACLAPTVDTTYLVATLLAFFWAGGLAAHALDELHYWPLRTAIPSGALVAAAVLGVGGALALGIAGVVEVGWPLVPFVVVGPLLVVAYNFELAGGIVHNDVGFAASWGAFPVLTAYVAQTGRLSWDVVFAALAAFCLSVAQRALYSSLARLLRRRASAVEGSVTLADGGRFLLDHRTLLVPLERALKMTAWAVVLGATALALSRLT